MKYLSFEIEERVSKSLQQLLLEDSFLFTINASERALTHRLAVYLEQQFPEWNVDCEYNRAGDMVKKIPLAYIESPSGKPRKVFPDIIVHQRGMGNNLLAIEIKKTNKSNPTSDPFDIAKLRAYRDCYGYQHCYFISLKTSLQSPEARVLEKL